MEMALVYTALGFGGVASVVALVLYVSRSRLMETVSGLQGKLTAEQSRLVELSNRSAPAKQKTETKAASESNKHNAELVELRKSHSHLKDEVKNLKSALREAEKYNKETDDRHDGLLFKLRAENSALLDRLKDLELNSPDKKRAQALEQQLSELQARSRENQQELSAANAKLKSERNHAERAKQHIESLQLEIKQLKAQIPETAPTNTVTSPSPEQKQIERWKDRALTARHMYRMMRQMRELSDLKLSTYQEAVADVSEFLLNLKGVPTPVPAANENRADRLLAEAWSLIHPEIPSSLTPPAVTATSTNTADTSADA